MPRLVRGFTPWVSNIIKTPSSTLNFQMDTHIAGVSTDTISASAVTADEADPVFFKKNAKSSIDVTLFMKSCGAGDRKRCGRITVH